MKKLFTFTLLLILAVIGYQAKAAMWLVGDAFNGWNESGNVVMTETEGIYSWQGELTAGKYFAFFKDSEGWSNQRGPSENNTAPTGDWETTESGNHSWKVATTGTYVIEYNYSTDQAKIALQQFDPAARKFAVTGAAFGGWNMPPTEAQIFTNNGDGTYTLIYEGAVAGGFKLSGVGINDVFGNNDWSVFNGGAMGASNLVVGENELRTDFGSGNMSFPVNGDVTLTISEVTETSCKLNIAVNEEHPIEISSYTIVGESTMLFGTAWDPENDSNDMSELEEGIYTLVKNNVELSQGNYLYKVTANHTWGVFELPAGQNNQTLVIPEDGKYNVTFKLTLGDNPVLTADATKVGDIVIDHTYTIAGVMALMGVNWDVNAETNNMAKQDDGTYVLVKEDVELEVNTNPGYGYKVVRDHSWDWSIPQDDANQYLLISTHGMYDVKFTLTLGDNPTLVAEAVLKQEILPDYILHYGVSEQQWQDKVFVAGEGEYEGKLIAKEVEFAENTEFGIKYGDTWYAGLVTEGSNYLLEYGHCTNIPLDSEGNIKNFHINQAGTYTFILTVGEDGITMDVEGLQAPPAPDYILHYGNDNVEWQNATFVAGEGEYAGKLLAKEVVFAADTEFEINYGNICYGGLPNGEEPHYWIHYGWCENIPLSTGEGIKHFIINEAGTYSFILTIGEDGITMDVLGLPVPPTPAVLGDLDGNGTADVTDVNILVNMILGKQAKTKAADLDNSGDVDVTDVNLLVNIILGKSNN